MTAALNPVAAICPYCGIHVSFSWTEPTENGGSLYPYLNKYFENKNGVWVVGQCAACENCVLISGAINNHNLIPKRIYPYPQPSPVNERMPRSIKKDLEEAKLCFSVGAFNATAAMSRRAIQRACKEKGAAKGDLINQIDEISDKKIITDDLKELAHAVRLIGNDGAHPNEIDVSEPDAKEILELAEQFMEVVFVAPAKVKEIKEKREKK